DGNDSIIGGLGNDNINAGDGADTVQGGDGNDTVDAAGGNDSVQGGIGGDLISGGAGNDTIDGGAGTDTLSGGEGADRFVFASGDSGVTLPLDRITDWDSSDSLDFASLAAGSSSNYLETSADTFEVAKQLADSAIGGGTVDYVAVQVGANVVVFADTAGNNGAAEDAVVLVGKTLADISFTNFV